MNMHRKKCGSSRDMCTYVCGLHLCYNSERATMDKAPSSIQNAARQRVVWCAVVVSVLLCGAETWTLKAKHVTTTVVAVVF